MRISDWSSDVCSSDLQSRNDVMLELDEVARLAGVRRSELTTWIEERWVLPVQEEGRWRFGDVDVARVRLIVELQRDLDIGVDAQIGRASCRERVCQYV